MKQYSTYVLYIIYFVVSSCLVSSSIYVIEKKEKQNKNENDTKRETEEGEESEKTEKNITWENAHIDRRRKKKSGAY